MFHSWTRYDVARLVVREADQQNVKRKLALRTGIAESGLQVYSERWGLHTNEGRAAAEARDFAAIERVLAKMRADKHTYDCSFGVGQKIVIYAPVGNQTMTPANILEVREWLFNPYNAVRVMVDQIGGLYRHFLAWGKDDEQTQLMALYAYNTGKMDGTPPDGEYASNAIAYQRAGVEASVLMAVLGMGDEDMDQAAISEIQNVLDSMFARASAHRQNGEDEEASFLFTAIDRIIAAYPRFGRG